ncbi:MAG TPA: hypothetical protein VJ720_04655 [Chitinophaga sp.]|nr:hypothetical protein [Chitinophaga sp.]
MAQLKYTSIHPCHLTLRINDEPREFSFFKDEIYDLPEDNSVIKRMQAQGLLEAILTNTQLKNKKSNGS